MARHGGGDDLTPHFILNATGRRFGRYIHGLQERWQTVGCLYQTPPRQNEGRRDCRNSRRSLHDRVCELGIDLGNDRWTHSDGINDEMSTCPAMLIEVSDPHIARERRSRSIWSVSRMLSQPPPSMQTGGRMLAALGSCGAGPCLGSRPSLEKRVPIGPMAACGLEPLLRTNRQAFIRYYGQADFSQARRPGIL